jgi:hypothetical protein
MATELIGLPPPFQQLLYLVFIFVHLTTYVPLSLCLSLAVFLSLNTLKL